MEFPLWLGDSTYGCGSHEECDKTGAIAQANDSRNHKKGKHIERKYHTIREWMKQKKILIEKIPAAHNLVDHFTKSLSMRAFESHVEGMGNWSVSDVI